MSNWKLGQWVVAIRECHRQFLCARCRKQVTICSHCDRGQIYCSKECSKIRRRELLRMAARRYQKTPRGAHYHARRQHHYRLQNQKVTHQGSNGAGLKAVCGYQNGVRQPCTSLVETQVSGTGTDLTKLGEGCCKFCGRLGSKFTRTGFIKTRRHLDEHRRRARGGNFAALPR